MQVILDRSEVKEAIQCYLSREGIDTDKYDLDIKIVVSRSSEDTKIEVEMNQKEVIVSDVEVPAYMETVEVANPGSPFGDIPDEATGD